MTAINAAVFGDTGFMLTDTGVYGSGQNPAIAGFAAKALPIAHASSVIACSGPHHATEAVKAIAASFADFDQIRRELPAQMRSAIATLGNFNPALTVKSMTAVVLGYSELERSLRLFLAWTKGNYEAENTPIVHSPALTDRELADAGWTQDQRGDASLLPGQLLAVMKKQREVGRGIDEGQSGIVGGAAVLTTITRHEISQRVIHRWPDKVGERIVA